MAGSQVKVPTVTEGSAALQGVAPAPGAAAGTGSPGGGAPQPLGGYVVRAGDTLSGLAAQAGVPVAQMAYMNGIAPDALLVEGTVLKLPTGAPAPAQASEPAPARRVVPAGGPQPAPGVLSSGQVSTLAAEHGVPGSLAAAIGWQESGFNNAMVSSANARGIMQVMPGTWAFVQQHAGGRPGARPQLGERQRPCRLHVPRPAAK